MIHPFKPSKSLCILGVFVAGISFVAKSRADVDGNLAGQRIYEQHCASCHGATGEGVAEKQPEPLVGDRSLLDLTEVIIDTMPEENPDQVVGDEAKAVAEYIHEAFYSPIAQARNKPPRVELSRLTVRQYQNTVADLIGGFTGANRWDERRGLNAEYFDSKNTRRDKRVIERVDATVDLEFGEGSPGETIGNEEFSIKWQGSVIVPDTVGQAKMRWLGIDEGHHELSHHENDKAESQDKLTRINKWFAGELAYLARRLSETPEPGGTGSMLDNTVILWGNELGQGNSHTLDNIPFVMLGNGLDFNMGRSLKYKKVPHNRLLLSIAHGFGHEIETFGNPDFCGDGPLTGLNL